MTKQSTDLPVLIRELRELHAQATRGPWHRRGFEPGVGCNWVDCLPPGSLPILTDNGVGALGQVIAATPDMGSSNARLIVAAVNALPQLLDALESAMRARDGAQMLTRAVSATLRETIDKDATTIAQRDAALARAEKADHALILLETQWRSTDADRTAAEAKLVERAEKAERERDEALAHASHLAVFAERDRYRSALEDIERIDADGHEAGKLARKALEGT